MKKFVIFLSFLICFFAFASSTPSRVNAVVQAASVGAMNNGIERDQVNFNAIGYTNISTESTLQTNITGEKIKSFTSQINVQKDGKIQVKETIVYDFDTLQKHGIYRTIPTIKTNTDGKKFKLELSNFIITDENGLSIDYDRSEANEKISFKIGNPNKTISGVHTYVISYQVSGALTYFSDHDELYWNATGNEWKVPIQTASTLVQFPTDIEKGQIKTTCYTGIINSLETQCIRLNYDRSQVVINASKTLQQSEGLTIVVGFPKNIVTVIEPKLVVPFAETLLGKLFFLGLSLLATWWYILYPFIIIFKWWKHGRDPSAGSGQVPLVGVTTAWFDPPKTPKSNRFMTPGEVGTLGDETIDMKDISATIIDLAHRGYIKIEERKKDDFYFIRTKFNSVETKEFNRLLSFEKKLLSGIFDSEKEIRLKDQELYETVTDVTKELYNDVVEIGLFPKNPQSIRTFYSVISILALFTGNFFLAFVAFLFGRNMPRKTLDGVNAFNIAKSLKNFLTSQERQLEFLVGKSNLPAGRQVMFEKLLPYAIAFGVEKIWAKRFETINLQQPSWYRGYGLTNFNSVIFANSLNSSISSFKSSANPPTSTRSSSGFSSGFSGGFSGGGGGGGGGGSW